MHTTHAHCFATAASSFEAWPARGHRLHQSLLAAWLLLGLLLAPETAAAAARILAQPSETRVTLGEAIQVSVSVEADELGSPDIIPPSSPDFRIEGQPMQSSRFELINGRARRSQELTFLLRPTRAGTVSVPPFVYQNRFGSTVQSQPFDLLVIEPPPPPRGVEEISAEEPLTVLLEAKPAQVYMGQQTFVSVTRYSRVQMDQCVAQAPEVPKAWFENLLETPPPPRVVALSGARFEAGLLRHSAVFPLQSGTLEIPPVEVQCRSVGRGFFGSGAQVLTRSTAPATLEVLPLPEAGRPAGFGGAVGRFRCSGRLDRGRTRVGEPITLQLTVAGQGNFHGFTLTAPRLPPVLTTFPPTTTDDLSYDAQGLLQGKKTLELILSPKSAGRIELPAVSFPYFDPEQATYQVAQSQPLLLEVDEAKESLAGGRTTTPGSAGAGIALLELPDLRPLRPGGHLLLPGAAAPRPLPEQPSFWLGLALPPLALSCVGLRDRLLQHRRKNEGLQRYRRARRTAARRMEQAAAQRSSPQVFWAEAAAVLHGYLEDRLGQPTRGLTRARLQAVLADEQGYPLPLVDELLDLFDEADLARFAGGPGEMDLGRAGQRTMTMLDRLDRHIPRSPAAAGPELPR